MILLTGILTDLIPGYPITYDTLLISVFGGLINGAVISLCLFANATSGGTDFIAIYLSEKKGMDSWNLVLGLNVLILGAAGLLFVTDHPQEVCDAISNTCHHGATILNGEGSYEHCERHMVYSVVSSAESKHVLKAVREVDKHAFINVIKTSQLSGHFYQKPED